MLQSPVLRLSPSILMSSQSLKNAAGVYLLSQNACASEGPWNLDPCRVLISADKGSMQFQDYGWS